MLITDAHSEEIHAGAQDFRNLIENFDMVMSLLVVNQDTSQEFRQTCLTLTRSEHLLTMLNPKVANTMHTAIAGLLLNLFSAVKGVVSRCNVEYRASLAEVAAASTDEGSSPQVGRGTFIERFLPYDVPRPVDVDAVRTSSLEKSLKDSSAPRPDVLYRVSARSSTLPAELTADTPSTDPFETTRRESLEEAKANLIKFQTESIIPDRRGGVTEAVKIWEKSCLLLASDIAALATVFEDDVFQFNRFTRRRAALKGSTLYLPGLIKAIITDFNFKKIFGSRTAGGRRQYSVTILVDISASMMGQMESAVAATLVMLTTALTVVGLDHFSLMTFGDRVRLLKSSEQPWDATAQVTLLSQLRFDTSFRTLDADAVNMAVLHELDSNNRGPKRVFVLTDGFTNQSRDMVHALHRAERKGVEVIGIGVGVDMTVTRRLYQHWIQAALPSALPDAFRELYSGDETSGASAAEITSPLDHLGRNFPAEVKVGGSTERILSCRSRLFNDTSAHLSEEREARLTAGNGGGVMTLDIAFVVDFSGSMAPALNGIKTEIANIARNIPPLVREQCGGVSLLMRVALVPFRDIGDAAMQGIDFVAVPADISAETIEAFNTQQLTGLTETLRRLHPDGGGDIPEDVFGAFRKTVTLGWSSRVRYAVLITDAPPHGLRFIGPPLPGCSALADSHPHASDDAEAVVESLVQKQIEVVVCHVNRTETQHFERELKGLWVDAVSKFPGKIPSTEMLTVDLCDPAARTAAIGGLHVVFVLDESGSMSGAFSGVVNAYNQFLNIRKRSNQGRPTDLISVITFDGNAKVHACAVRVQDVLTQIPFRGGGTDFGPAMQCALEILNSDLSSADRRYLTPVLIFMSDGCGGSGISQLQSIYANHSARGLKFHVMGFGGVDSRSLTDHANAAHGTYYNTPDVTSLAAEFSNIANSVQGASGLTNAVAARVGRAISNRLVMDHI